MTLSLNEVDAIAKKATRGAGYPWGLAEEAGKAVRWLCALGVDGCGALALALRTFDGALLSEVTPVTDTSDWYAPGPVLCPLMTGTALSDRADVIQNTPIRTKQVLAPDLLLFFAANIATQCKGVVTVEWADGSAVTNGSDLSLNGQPAGLVASNLRIFCGGTLGVPLRSSTRVASNNRSLETLFVFAHRTYAPATEESRRKGAGENATNKD